MSYSQFTTIEGVRFLPELEPIFPSKTISNYLEESLSLAVATGIEKARSELSVSPILVEVRRILKQLSY